MENLLRITTISNTISPAKPKESYASIMSCINSIKEKDTDIVLLSLNSLLGNSLGMLLYNNDLLKTTANVTAEFINSTKEIDTLFVLGTLKHKEGIVLPCSVAVYKGEILYTAFANTKAEPFLFKNCYVKIAPVDDTTKLLDVFYDVAKDGSEIVLMPAGISAKTLKYQEYIEKIKHYAKETSTAVAFVNAGHTDTSYPYIYGNVCLICEEDSILFDNISYQDNIIATKDIDIDIIRSGKRKNNLKLFDNDNFNTNDKKILLKHIDKNPYFDSSNNEAFYKDLFNLSSVSLARRLSLTKISKMVIGVSGGLDSTLALLACANVSDILKLPRENIIAVTMPGFGTTNKTKSNAHILMEKLGVTIKEISIVDSVLLHLKDINHNINIKDVTYENAQARERTQILLDIANKNGGLVVGTGDLSEEALGFCTFGGDHLSQYNVNTCITKTMLKGLLTILLKDKFSDCSTVLIDILNTPISPELLPPDEDDNITQKTENILGPYMLHDFFLYYFIKYNMVPQKILEYAYYAFKDEFSYDYIKEKLNLFLRRFYLNQYKRSCAPDSAVITEINLSNSEFYIPSDVLVDIDLK